MTLIIAEEEAERIVMGADSAAGSKDEIYIYNRPLTVEEIRENMAKARDGGNANLGSPKGK